MKRFMVFIILGFGLLTFAEADSNVLLDSVCYELESFVNGCGPEWVPGQLRGVITELSRKRDACRQHDLDYFTLGMSKGEADYRFLLEMLSSGWMLPMYNLLITATFYDLVALFGDSSYESAQAESREAFRGLHGFEWE